MTTPPRRENTGSGRQGETTARGGPARGSLGVHGTRYMTIQTPDRTALLALVERFPRQRVIMLGDLVADEFVYGEIVRVSREAPVLILKEREKQVAPGGGANAANNLAALGAQVTPVGVVGDDESGDALLHYFRERHISTRQIVRVRNYLTPTKSRILGGLSHWQRQQVVRIDREPAHPLAAEVRNGLTRAAAALLGSSTGLLVADYGYRTTNAKEVDSLRRRTRRHALPITIDSRYDLLTYKNLTAATPNEPESRPLSGSRLEMIWNGFTPWEGNSSAARDSRRCWLRGDAMAWPCLSRAGRHATFPSSGLTRPST